MWTSSSLSRISSTAPAPKSSTSLRSTLGQGPPNQSSRSIKHMGIVVALHVLAQTKLCEILCANILQYPVQGVLLAVAHLIHHGLEPHGVIYAVQKGDACGEGLVVIGAENLAPRALRVPAEARDQLGRVLRREGGGTRQEPARRLDPQNDHAPTGAGACRIETGPSVRCSLRRLV